jgi:hypothetical protein
MAAPYSQLSCVFGGTNEYVTIGDVLGFERTDSFSVSFWFKTTDTGWKSLIGKSEGASNYRGWGVILSGISAGSIRFTLTSISGSNHLSVRTTGVYNDGEWHHGLVTYDGSSSASGVTWYIDGGSVAMTTVDDTLSATIVTTRNLLLAANDDGAIDHYTGSLDEVAVYDVELTSSDVVEIYNGGAPSDLLRLDTSGDLVGWWRMGDGDVYPTLMDHSISGNNGTMTNMESADIQADVPTGRFSVEFGGTNEYVTMGDVLGFERTDSFSVSFWFKTTDTGWKSLIGKSEGASNYRGWGVILSGISAGSVRFQLTSVAGSSHLSVRTTGVYNDGEWHHGLVTYDGSSSASGVTWYIDGETVAMTTVDDTLSTTIATTHDLLLAANDDGAIDHYTGNLDEVAVYDVELTSSDVVEIYNAGNPAIDLAKASSAGSLAGYWKCGDGDTYPTIADHSGNGNDGTMTNMEATDIVNDSAFARLPVGSPLLPRVSGYSAAFGGTDEYVTMGDVLGFERTDTFSISVWVKTTLSAIGHIVGKTANSTAAPGWALLIDSTGRPYFDLINSLTGNNYLQIGTTTATVKDGRWHHLVLAYDGSSAASGVTFYIDGVSVASLTTYQNTLSASTVHTDPLTVGRRANHPSDTYPYVGSLDEVAVYDIKLTAAEVSRIHNGGSPCDLAKLGTYADLVGWWRMGDGDTFPTLADHGSGDNDGTMTNMEASDIQRDVPLAGGAIQFTQGTERDIGKFSTVTGNTAVTLRDAKGYGAIAWQWEVISAPGPVGTFPAITNDGAKDAFVTPSTDGVYVVRVTRTDIGGESVDTQAFAVLDGEGHALPSAGLGGSLINTSDEALVASWIGRADAQTDFFFDAYLRWLKEALKNSQTFEILSGLQKTDSTSFVGVGAVRLNESNFPSYTVATFQAVFEVASGYTAEVRLYNLTDDTTVSGSVLSTTSTSSVVLEGTLTLPSGQKDYEVQLRVTAGGGFATCTGARIILT